METQTTNKKNNGENDMTNTIKEALNIPVIITNTQTGTMYSGVVSCVSPGDVSGGVKSEKGSSFMFTAYENGELLLIGKNGNARTFKSGIMTIKKMDLVVN